MNKFSKMKVHWWTYNHCLFVSHLTSVAFQYGGISDTKFQKFLDKDWIWIFKRFIGYGSGVKKSISAHLWVVHLRRLHNETGYGLRCGLLPVAVFLHVARIPPPTTPAIRLKTILSKPEACRNRENSAGYGQRSLCEDCRWP